MLRANVIVTAADEVAWWLAYSDSSEWPDGDEAKIRRYIDGLQRRSGFQGADVPRHVAYLADAIRRRKSGEVFDVEGPGARVENDRNADCLYQRIQWVDHRRRSSRRAAG